MTRALTGICTASLLALTVVGCGSGGPPDDSDPGRPFEASYEIRLDPDRTLRVDLQGEFTAWEDKSEADAGKTDILVHTTGKAEVTNVSDGRDTDDFKAGFELFLPVTECPNWGDGDDTVGTHCNYDIFDVEIDTLEAGDTDTVHLDEGHKIDEVPVEQADTVLAAIHGRDGALVSADRVFWNQQLEELNPTCNLPGGGKWVTYFSESDDVDACSTEPGAG